MNPMYITSSPTDILISTYAEVFYPLFIKRASLNKRRIDYYLSNRLNTKQFQIRNDRYLVYILC